MPAAVCAASSPTLLRIWVKNKRNLFYFFRPELPNRIRITLNRKFNTKQWEPLIYVQQRKKAKATERKGMKTAAAAATAKRNYNRENNNNKTVFIQRMCFILFCMTAAYTQSIWFLTQETPYHIYR